MKQSLPLSAGRQLFRSARSIAICLSIGFALLFSFQPSNAADQETKNFKASEGPANLSNGTVGDVTANRSSAVPSVDAVEISAALPYKYFGNNFSGKFHRPWCPYSQAMNVNHVVPFNFRWQAIKSGYSPCNYCLPQQWKSVHCVLLKQSPQ